MKARSRVTNSQSIWMTPQGDDNPVRNGELHGEMMIVPPQTGGAGGGFSPSSEGSDAGGGGRHGLAD